MRSHNKWLYRLDIPLSGQALHSFSSSRLYVITIDTISFCTWEKLSTTLCRMFQKAGIKAFIWTLAQASWNKERSWTLILHILDEYFCYWVTVQKTGNIISVSLNTKFGGKKNLETFQWIQPPSAQISRWSSTNLLTEENVMKKTDISQKYCNTKSEKATYLFIFPPTDQNFCRWQPATLIFFMLLLLKGDSTVHQQNNL